MLFRYYLYNWENGNIGRIRDGWQDATIHQNLPLLWQDYVRVEEKVRKIDANRLLKQIRETKQKFLDAERHATRLSQGAD
jgi:hypothetical protein